MKGIIKAIGIGGLALLVACTSEKDCKPFKTGEFSYTKNSTVRIIRNDSIQKEFDLEADWKEITRIHWTGACSYYLTLVESNQPEGTSFKKGDTLWVEITNTKGDEAYSFSAALKGELFENTMIKLNEL